MVVKKTLWPVLYMLKGLFTDCDISLVSAYLRES